jgi:site-specific DNA-methyltransferase (adenine-specific)
MTYESYQAFTYQWLLKAKEWSHPHTRLCLNVPLDKNRFGHESVYADVVTTAKQVGWTYFTTVVWNEGTISVRTAWGSWKSPSAPYIITPVEMIAVFYLDPARTGWKIDRSSKSPDITGEEFLQWTNGLWTFNGENAKRIGHPAPFPVELPRRCIKFFTYPSARVLDPFVGSGTTLVACRELNRKGVGFEIDPHYVRVARKRLKI